MNINKIRAIACAAALTFSGYASALSYQFTGMGTLELPNSATYGINDAG